MSKMLALFVVAIALTASFAHAADEFAGLDIKSISDANDSVVEAALNVDVDALANKVQKEDAIEACFHRCGYYGGCGYSCYNNCCYNSYCYSPCCYNTCCSYTCYQPTYYVAYHPVCYTTYTTSCYSPCSYWGCGCNYGY